MQGGQGARGPGFQVQLAVDDDDGPAHRQHLTVAVIAHMYASQHIASSRLASSRLASAADSGAEEIRWLGVILCGVFDAPSFCFIVFCVPVFFYFFIFILFP